MKVSGALILTQTLPPQYTPQIKYFPNKMIWAREQKVNHRIKLLKIDTMGQLRNIFTKGLTRFTFECLRKKLIGC